jgi:hypothetical protein
MILSPSIKEKLMNVQEVIDELMKVKDKTKEVQVSWISEVSDGSCTTDYIVDGSDHNVYINGTKIEWTDEDDEWFDEDDGE